MSDFTKDQINKMVRDYIKQTLSDDEKCRAQGIHTIGDLYTSGGSGMGQAESEALGAVVKTWLKNQDHEFLHPAANKLLEKHGHNIKTESSSYKDLSRELMLAFQSVLNVRVKRSQGDYTQSDEELIPRLKEEEKPVIAPSITPVSTQKSASLTFTEVQGKYIAEVEKGGTWTTKTMDANLAIFALFVRCMGDLPVDQIDRPLMSEYKSILMQLPSNLNKLSKYKDLSIEEIIASKPEQTISVSTLNKYLQRLSGLFNYASRNGFMLSNPAEGMVIKQPKRASDERDAYSQADLAKLFESPDYGKHEHSYAFWSPLIAVYTGCRLEEICQLHLEDIRNENGVWVFDINNKDEKHLKNDQSVRLIPIHSHLIHLGLLDHVQHLKDRGEKRLFPELLRIRDGYGQKVSKWYQNYKKRFGFGRGKTFHSFRHTFITHLKHKQIDTYMLKELAGHDVEGETMGRYGKRFPPEILKEAIEKLDYGIDFSGLKWTSECATE
jgi:integrase